MEVVNKGLTKNADGKWPGYDCFARLLLQDLSKALVSFNE
jgi:hypothetical protein